MTHQPKTLAASAADDLAKLAKHPALGDGTLDDLAELVDVLDRLTADAVAARAAIAAAVAELMTDDSVPVAGIGVITREPGRSVSWDTKGARAAIIKAIIRGITADYDDHAGDIARRAVEETYAAVGGSPKVTGMTKLGLDADAYRATSVTGWKVKLMRVEGLAPQQEDDRW